MKTKKQTARCVKTTFIKGFTLAELMVVIVIIGVLAGLVVGAIRGAQQDTYAAKTRATIAKIEAVINDRMDEYLTKDVAFASSLAVPTDMIGRKGYGLIGGMPPDIFLYGLTSIAQKFPRVTNRGLTGSEKVSILPNNAPFPATVPARPPAGLLRERTRLAAVRDVMRMEMPDSVGDLYYYDTISSTNAVRRRPPMLLMTGHVNGAGANIMMRAEITPRYEKIHERVFAADAALFAAGVVRDSSTNVHTPGYSAGTAHWYDTFANEELLFLIVEDSYIDGDTALSSFGTSEIADRDGDGLREFVDAWGVPIRWLRWPAGVKTVSPATPDPLDISGIDSMDGFDPSQSDVGYEWTSEVAGATVMEDRFPLKPQSGLRPMIVSAGLDGRFGIRFYWADDPRRVWPVLRSSSAVEWPVAGASGTFSKLGYWPDGFRWPDPYYPRIEPTTLPPASTLNPYPTLKLGGVLDSGIDAGELFGIDLETSPPTAVYYNFPTAFPSVHSSDNVSNLDESGAAP